MRVIEIRTCMECPFARKQNKTVVCNHRKRPDGDGVVFYLSKDEISVCDPLPDWCPLKDSTLLEDIYDLMIRYQGEASAKVGPCDEDWEYHRTDARHNALSEVADDIAAVLSKDKKGLV